jgi:hypothetical protein
LSEPPSVRRHQDHRRRGSAIPADVFHGPEQRLRLQHHAGTAAKWHVVDHALAVGRVIAEVVHAHIEQPALDCTRDNTFRERPLHHLRKDGDDIDLHCSAMKE